MLASVKMLYEAGIKITLKMPLMKHNVDGYKKFLELCDTYNAQLSLDYRIVPTTDSNSSVCRHQITDEKTLSQLFCDYRLPLSMVIDENMTPNPNRGRGMMPLQERVCVAGRISLSVCPDGTVYPCNGLPLPLGNVRQQSIAEIRQNSPALKAWQSVVLNDFDECGMYEMCSYCSICPGIAMSANGNIFGKNDASCLVAKVRYDLDKQFAAGASLNVNEHFGNDLT